MSASPYLSKHLPGIAAGVVSVTGSAIVQTGLKEVTGATGNIKADSVTANEETTVVANWGGSLNPGEVRLAVYKGGTASGTIGDSAVDVSFMAHGDR